MIDTLAVDGVAAPPSPLIIVPNVTAHPSTANVPIWLWSFALRF